jgi:copper homeostasis protein (lipoprotein)
LAQVAINPAGQPPYRFSIDYDPAEIDPRHSYAVSARLYDGDELLFISDTVHQVITRDFPSTVTIRMRQVGTNRGANRDEKPLDTLPATFFGTLPCADCPGIDTTLVLLEQGAYFFRQDYQDREPGVFDDIGRFLPSSHADQIALYGGREAAPRLAIVNSHTLAVLDLQGAPIVSELNYNLTRQADAEPFAPQLLMRGQYRYMAGAGRFSECLTGLDMAVAQEADNANLERAYAEARDEPGSSVLVGLEGRIERRPRPDSETLEWVLVPLRLISITADQDCPPPMQRADLHNTYWRLTLLDGEGIIRAPNQREPHLIFNDEGRVAGSDGCNRLIGSHRIDGRSLHFSQLAGTKMACPDGMEQAEQFIQTLESITSYHIIGPHLELFDDDGALRLRFEATAL